MIISEKMNEALLETISKFKDTKILVIGDIMLDKYVWGDVSRISPEAPVQVVKALKETYSPGGAANVANNIAALGGEAHVIGLVGDDDAKEILIAELDNKGINTSGIIIDKERPTIQKVRLIGRNQQLLRVDYEKNHKVSDDIESTLIDFIISNIDYFAKGIITDITSSQIIKLCNEKNKIIVVDPKPHNKRFYKKTTLITPNHTEAIQMATSIEKENSDQEIEEIGKTLQDELQTSILITRGEKGMSLFENNEITHIPTYAKEVYDIVGAGDTSVATLTLALACKATKKQAAILANHAAGITVGKIGTSTSSIEELKNSIQNE
jgi:rfaE bifunctional protein kinase chain/domain